MRRLVAALALVLFVAACSGTGDTTPPTEAESGTSSAETTATIPDDGVSTGDTTSTGSGTTCWTAAPAEGSADLTMTDVTEEVGLIDPLLGIHGHAAVWTDANNDGWADLFVGTFADRDIEIYQERGASGPSPDQVLTFNAGTFATSSGFPEVYSRSSGGAPVDLDNDGDLDLVISRNIKDDEVGPPPTQIYANDGGVFTPIEPSGVPVALGGRAVGVLDYDSDGFHDLLVTEDRWTGGSSVLLHNNGNMTFHDATAEAGLPGDIHGLGLAIADFNNDGAVDIFVSGSNRLFFSDGSEGFVEQDGSVFKWDFFGEEDDVAGATAADVNRDGWVDLAVGHHFNSTIDLGERVPVRLYLNQGEGTFADVTEEVGLIPLPTKAPHVEFADLDNDGWPDLVTSASAEGGPAIFMHEGLDGGMPHFRSPGGMGDPQYWVAAPTSDFDRDGRLDVFLLEWEPSLPSLLLRNTTQSGNWLEISVGSEEGFGIGWRVEIFDGVGDLVGSRDITVTQGYSAGVLPLAHFGLGEADEVTVVLTPPGESRIQLDTVGANQHIRWPEGCS